MTATHTFIVICEGMDDMRVAESLTTRVLTELGDWISTAFRGLEENEAYSSWAGVRARSADVPKRKGFRGDDWTGDAETARRALHLASTKPVAGVVLLRDSDNADARQKRAALHTAVNAFRKSQPSIPVAFGVAEQKIEAWFLASIEVTKAQRVALAQEQLGFDPISNPERLTATDPQAKNNAKRVLRLFFEMSQAIDSLRSAPLERLIRNGEKAGLREFLCDIRLGIGPSIVDYIPDTGWCRRTDHSREN